MNCPVMNILSLEEVPSFFLNFHCSDIVAKGELVFLLATFLGSGRKAYQLVLF